MNESTDKAFEQATAFQRIWMETFSRLTQAGFSFSPETAPPEFMRQMRSGLFSALARAWEDYMRTPQFMESMKTMMESATTFRQLSNDFLTQAHHSMQSTAQSDIDNVLLAIRHLETRLLDRVEDVSKRLDQLEAKVAGGEHNGKTIHTSPKAATRRGSRRTAA